MCFFTENPVILLLLQASAFLRMDQLGSTSAKGAREESGGRRTRLRERLKARREKVDKELRRDRAELEEVKRKTWPGLVEASVAHHSARRAHTGKEETFGEV